jgi:hypothetical protein
MSTEENRNKDTPENSTAAFNEILDQIREQRHELNSLKEDVRGSNLCVANEVKKLKDREIQWKNKGNKVQYEFNSVCRILASKFRGL